MNLHRSLLFILLFFLFCRPVSAQYADFVVGFKAGGAFSGLSNLENMIVPEDYYDKSTYSLGSKSVFGAVAGVFVHFRVPGTFFAMQPEVTYSMQGSTLSYRDNTDFTYDMGFKYHYVGIALLFKAQAKGLSLRAGPRLGFSVNPEAITYTSNSRLYGEDQDTQQGFRNVMKGRSDFSLGAGLAYEFPFGLGVEAMYYFGLSDTVETLTNSYNFVENSNRSRSVQLTVSYTLPLTTEGKRPR
jgi:hypothetical protein